MKHDPEKESIPARPEGVPACLFHTGHVPADLPQADEPRLDPGKSTPARAACAGQFLHLFISL